MIKNFIKIIIHLPIIILSKIVKRKENIWVFGTWFGDKYNDNSKYLFEYVNNNCPDIKAIWLTTNKKTLNIIRQKKYNAYLTYSFMGYFYSLIAKYGFICTGFNDLNIYTLSNMRIINLWHGIPLKKIMNDNKFQPCNQKQNFIIHAIKKYLNRFRNFQFYTTLVDSDLMKNIFEKAFYGHSQRIDIIGQARCDSFFINNFKNLFVEKLVKLKKENYKVGIYMPTCRNDKLYNEFWEYFTNELNNLNMKMKNMNIVLLIKLHYYQLKRLKSITNTFSNLILIKDEDIEQDVYSILPITDFLITDYSSIFFDYLFTNKPIFFCPFDIQEYLKRDDEMYFDYETIIPGKKANTWEELYKNLEEYVQGIDTYKEQRKILRDKIFVHQDGKNCERIIEWITSLD